MSTKLKDLIRTVRNCKNVEEEKGVVQKECASIRVAFKEGKDHYRNRCMLKLLYISMLGYPTEFGQMEVIKLIAQPEYAGKRIGYLTMSIVLDERSEVLTLAENHIKKDLANTNPYVQCLALDTVSNIAGLDMSRDVLIELLPLVDNTNVYLKKKACLAALRCVKKAPENAEAFLEKLSNPFAERNHAALLTSLALINECLVADGVDNDFIVNARKQVPAAVRFLKTLVLSSRTSDHDVCGIADPFLQVRILQFLRIVGQGCTVASDEMNDCLAQVITNTDGARNVGNAVLYEAVRTINSIESDASLQSLAVNTLGRFLSNTRDNNIRFVALNSLLSVANRHPEATREHLLTVVECLKDVDGSIRQMALRLTIALIDDSNVRIVVPDLISFLHSCADDNRGEVSAQICDVVLNKAPSPEWRAEMALQLFVAGGRHVPENFALDFIAYVTQGSDEVKAAAVTGSWDVLANDKTASLFQRESFLVSAIWCLGEYPQYVVSTGACTAMTLVGTIVDIASNATVTSIKNYSLNAVMKLATRYPELNDAALDVFHLYATSLDCELQQRALEYITLLEDFPELAQITFKEMPAIELVSSEDTMQLLSVDVLSGKEAEAAAQRPQHTTMSTMWDDIFAPPTTTTPTTTATQPPRPSNHFDDIFASVANGDSSSKPTHSVDDIFGAPSATSYPPPPKATGNAPKPAPKPAGDLDDLFGHKAPSPTSQQQPQAPPPPQPVYDPMNDFADFPDEAPRKPQEKEVFRNEYLIVSLSGARVNSGEASGRLVLTSTTNLALVNVSVFIAVLKDMTSSLSSLPSSVLGARGSLVQEFAVNGPSEKLANGLNVRVKLQYTVNGNTEAPIFQAACPF